LTLGTSDLQTGVEPDSHALTRTQHTISQTVQDAESYLKTQEIKNINRGEQNRQKIKYRKIYAKGGRGADESFLSGKDRYGTEMHQENLKSLGQSPLILPSNIFHDTEIKTHTKQAHLSGSLTSQKKPPQPLGEGPPHTNFVAIDQFQ